MKETFYSHLDRLIDGKLPYAIWGAGKTGIETLALIKEYTKGEFLPEFIIDNNPALWEREDVISPMLFFMEHADKIDTVFVCVYVADEVGEQLRREKFTGEIVPVSTTAMGNPSYASLLDANIDSVNKLFQYLADEQSVDTIKVLREFLDTGDIGIWTRINSKSEDKLLEPGLLKFSENETFVEVGAFIGDTTLRFLNICKNKYEMIVGIEPDPDNYRILKNEYEKIERATALQYAAGNETKLVKFLSNRSESGAVSANGDIEIQQIRLDELPEARKASFIKVSTNGVERLALMGAEDIIRKNKPRLSYYCGRQKIWMIPEFLKSLVPEYKFYIRHYGIGSQAIIGYATID